MEINFNQLKMMLERGVVGVVKKNAKPMFNFGFRGGLYLGSPGKDIFFALPNLTEDEKEEIAKIFASLYPLKPPSNHVRWAAVIRYIYGCFEKQGCLRSKSDKKRMIEENSDWSISLDFMDRVAKYFELNNNKYGLVIHYEMLAHRYGDRAIIEKNEEFLIPMMKFYQRSSEIAMGIKCWKQTFTPFYWAGGYYGSLKKKMRAVECYMKCIRRMEKYCPDAREGYREKVKVALSYIKKHSDKKEWLNFKSEYKGYKNKCLRKVKI